METSEISTAADLPSDEEVAFDKNPLQPVPDKDRKAFQPPPGSVPYRTKSSPPSQRKGFSRKAPKAPKARGRWPIMALFGISVALLSFLGAAWLNLQGADTEGRSRVYMGPQQGREALELLLTELSKAESEIMLIAGEVNNRPLLEALIAQQRKGIQVLIVLDPSHPRTETVREHLIAQGVPASRVLLDRRPVRTQAVIIDRSTLILGSMPFSRDAIQQTGDLYFVRSAGAANLYRNHLERHVRAILQD